MKKIYFFLPTLKTGGAEKVATQLSFFLKNLDTHFILTEKKIELPYKGTIEILGANTSSKKGFIGKLIKLINLYNKLKKLKKSLDVNIVISFMSLQNILNVMSKKQEKVILSVRSFESLERGNTTLYKILIRFFYPKADAIVSVSKYAKQDLIDNFNIKEELIHVIYNPIDIELINKKIKDDVSLYKDLFITDTLVYVATLKIGKGHSHLIKIFKELKKKNHTLKLILIGNGPLKENLITLANSFELEVCNIEIGNKNFKNSDIVFLGHQENPYKFIKQCSIFVFPSMWEGFPNVLIEAMACKVPIVSSDCPSGPREIIAPNTNFAQKTTEIEYYDNGILVPYFDEFDLLNNVTLSNKEQLWITAIEELLNNSEMRDEVITNAFNSLNNYSPEYITNQWKKVILSKEEYNALQ